MRQNFYILFTLLYACGSSAGENTIATYADEKLTINDFIQTGTQYHNPKDSLDKLKLFVDQWLKQKSILNYAKENIDLNELEIENRVSQYKNDLIIAEFEKKYIEKNLDTTITEKQILSFYENNKSLFTLNDFIVKVFFIKADLKDGKIDALRNEIKNCNEAQVASIQDKYNETIISGFYENGNWIPFSDLLRELNFEVDDKASFLSKKAFFETETDEFIYLVRIFSYQLKNEASPINLVSNKIKKLILHQRTNEMLIKIRNDIISKNYSKGTNNVK